VDGLLPRRQRCHIVIDRPEHLRWRQLNFPRALGDLFLEGCEPIRGAIAIGIGKDVCF
jgi:hypothetical protein